MKMYLYGLQHFIVESDHKPLVPIINSKSLSDLSPRLQKLRMRLLKYNFTVQYVKGSDMIDADALSRNPASKPSKNDELAEIEIENHISQIIEMLPASNKKINEIVEETRKDTNLQELIQIMKSGWPNNKNNLKATLKQFWNYKDDLTEHNGLILKGQCILIPEIMRRNILNKLYEGHQGIEKTKRRARQNCFWPNINHLIKQKVKHNK